MRRALTITVLVLVGAAGLAGIAWIGSEMHYQSCLDAAQARHPVPAPSEPEEFGGTGGFGGLEPNDGLSREAERQRRQREVAKCDRWPL